MITVEFLKRYLLQLEEFSDAEKIKNQVLEGDGYDGIVAMLEEMRTVETPCVILEDRSFGVIDNLASGPLDTFSLPLWVMLSGTHDQATELFNKAFILAKKILSLFIRDYDEISELEGFDLERVSYNKRMGGNGYYGYELLCTFRVNINLLP